MTIRAHLLEQLADIAEKKKRNGLTSGLVVQNRETEEALKKLSKSDGEKEYVPSRTKKTQGLFYGF